MTEEFTGFKHILVFPASQTEELAFPMCGIAGKLDWRDGADIPSVKRMTDRLSHRGPDSDGFFAEGPIALGHRRLSVIDLRAVANQPMGDSTDRYQIVFNGEIYNFREIRRELENLGVRFSTNSDTQVLLESYARWGSAFLDRVNGMFALAIWDRREQTLLLARDRMGEKPLYYASLPDGAFVFASQADAILALPGYSAAIDPLALGSYLANNYVLGDRSILSGVRRLRPAHFLVVSPSGAGPESPFWSLADQFKAPKFAGDAHEAAEELTRRIDAAVSMRLVADVPLGAFLSGGVDSSAITAAMCRARDSLSVHTFGMGFEETAFDERRYARKVAGHLNVVHRDSALAMRPEQMRDALTAWDEPFADSSLLPTRLLSQFAREHVTVALSGDGGDELFGGYTTYLADRAKRLTDFVPASLFKLAGRAANRIAGVTYGKVGVDEMIRRFVAARGEGFAAAHLGWRRIFAQDEMRGLLLPEWRTAADWNASDALRPIERDVEGANDLDRAMYIDMRTWLPDNVLVKVDRAAMAWSLEVRAPFLDHDLVAFAARLPANLRIRGLTKKWVLKESQSRRLPRDILYRSKAGFSAPVSRWLLDWRKDPLIGDARHLAGSFFEPAAIDRLWNEHANGVADNGLKLFGLIALREWTRRHGLDA